MARGFEGPRSRCPHSRASTDSQTFNFNPAIEAQVLKSPKPKLVVAFHHPAAARRCVANEHGSSGVIVLGLSGLGFPWTWGCLRFCRLPAITTELAALNASAKHKIRLDPNLLQHLSAVKGKRAGFNLRR